MAPLALFSEVAFGQKAPDGFPATCPTLDLTATWDGAAQDLLVVRPPGQNVSKIHQYAARGAPAPEPVAIRWKPDGQFLAVGWSDGFLRLTGLESNKGVHSVQVCDPSAAKVTYIAWSICNLRRDRPPSLSSLVDQLSLSDGSTEESQGSDLPRDLTFVEIDTALPKISALPSASAGAGDEASVFTSRVGVEFLFQAPKLEDYDHVSAVLVGTSDGRLLLSICDSLTIGYFHYPKIDGTAPAQMIQHASHPLVSTHLLLLASEPKRPLEVELVAMDLPFLSSSPINMSLLASKLTTMQKLLRYMRQTQLHMQVEWKNTRELPNRFLRSVEGDLENLESGPRNVVAALFHTALTGHVYEPVREWLLDSLAERGHKRWDKAVVTGLEALRSLVHENFLPAVERCCIVLSRLRGLATFYDTRDDIGFSVTEIHRLLGILSSLTLVGHRILVMVMDELESFKVFSAWLRFQIDRLSAPSSAGEELTEKEALLDNSMVLKYIETYLTASPMEVFLREAGEDAQETREQLANGGDIPSELDRQLGRLDQGQPITSALPTVDFLLSHASSTSTKMFERIAEAQRRSVRFGRPVKLGIGKPVDLVAMAMQASDEKGAIIYTALASESAHHEVIIFRTGIEVVNGISTNLPATACALNIGPRRLIDVKFLGSHSLMLLCSGTDDTTVVLSIALRSLTFEPYSGDTESLPRRTDGLTEYSLPADLGMRAVQMEVHEQSDARAEMPVRISLLGKNRTVLRNFSLAA